MGTALYPNNEMRIYDNVLHQKYLRILILRYQHYYQVENGHDRDGLGSEENYFWKQQKKGLI